jgi:Niemann-Pick C1 protein
MESHNRATPRTNNQRLTEDGTRSGSPSKTTISCVVVFSVVLFVIGLLTNMVVEVDENISWTPKDSSTFKHMKWIERQSGFPPEPRVFVMIFHQSGGDNILGRHQVGRIFQALDLVRNLTDYQSVCAASESGECRIWGVTKFWNNSASIFDSEAISDEIIIETMSVSNFPDDGTPVSDKTIFGYPTRDLNGILTSAKSYTVTIAFPESEGTKPFESDALREILDLDRQWESESGNNFRVEVFAERSFIDEFERAIFSDIPLVPVVFVIISVFACGIFARKDRVRSRSLLGFSAVVSVLLSLVSGYGLMFVSGVPFTSVTQVRVNLLVLYS